MTCSAISTRGKTAWTLGCFYTSEMPCSHTKPATALRCILHALGSCYVPVTCCLSTCCCCPGCHVHSQVAVALGPSAYLWNAGVGSIEELCSLPNEGNYITSLHWAADSTHLAIGTSSARVQVRSSVHLRPAVPPP
eukprot:GHRQ01014821.1.p1 GENE.GHRQ01014821.1~~GHRQ01014821.1.p1  ORF type:complete len:136 (-),score=19.35 GHRQ01014821.1:571-978(-)